ncbi:MAG: acetyl-CoA C-acyltransferase [Firmicutes bacterium]|nr:acetyl-CoA C-acyltransferase [Bacillota bacterium]
MWQEKERDAVIVSFARTPIGKLGGSLSALSAAALGGLAMREALERAGLQPDQVDETILGMVVSAGAGQVPSRQAQRLAGIPDDVPSTTINKVCASGLRAVVLASQIIRCGDAEVIVAGGMESMSNEPYLIPKARFGYRMGDDRLYDAMWRDGLFCPIYDVHMAALAAQSAREYEVSRQEQDAWAYRSQRRWAEAEAGGFFEQERFAVAVPQKRGEPRYLEVDEAPRPQTTLEGLAALPPIFDETGTVTAGNAPGVNDGAGALVIMSREKAKELGCTPLVTIAAHAEVARDPKELATVPGLAFRKLLGKTQLALDEIERLEINEAFAAVPLISAKATGIPWEWMDEHANQHGGAVACGHPIGATGARLLATLTAQMVQEDLHVGAVTLCSGMAQGDAVLLIR